MAEIRNFPGHSIVSMIDEEKARKEAEVVADFIDNKRQTKLEENFGANKLDELMEWMSK